MTENEAIKELETSIDLAKMCTQNYERKREIQGYEIAIQALEKQIPKKPRKTDSYRGVLKRVYAYVCPTCGNVWPPVLWWKSRISCDCKFSFTWGASFTFEIVCSECKVSLPKRHTVGVDMNSTGAIVARHDERENAINEWNQRAGDTP